MLTDARDSVIPISISWNYYSYRNSRQAIIGEEVILSVGEGKGQLGFLSYQKVQLVSSTYRTKGITNYIKFQLVICYKSSFQTNPICALHLLNIYILQFIGSKPPRHAPCHLRSSKTSEYGGGGALLEDGPSKSELEEEWPCTASVPLLAL